VDYIEVTEFTGVRSAVIDFRRPGAVFRFVIFPMIHIGEPSYYAEVTERLRSCDLIIAESAPGASSHVRTMTRTYRPVMRTDRLGLVVQDIDYRSVGVPVVASDVSAEAFDSGWKERVPRWQSIGLRVAAPAVGLWLQHIASRRDIASALEAGDIPTLAELEAAAMMEGIVDVTLDQRNARLARAIRQVHRERGDEPLRVAIVWGAGHMRAVTTELYALGYRPGDAEWLTVFLLDEE
jgi:hypothetical protein